MRIIAGKYRGHKLVDFKAEHIRPTTDRVKETLFNKLQFQISGSRVADLFCGTGNLGLEALSREAEFCTFVEKSPQSVAITRQNIEKLKVPSNVYKVVTMDAISFLKAYPGPAFDIIFADPPFTQKLAHAVMTAASESAAFAPHTVMAIESEQKEKMEKQYGDLILFDKKTFGDKFLNMFCHKEALPAESSEKENDDE